MRNLRNTHHAAVRLHDKPDLAAVTWDGDDLICFYAPSHDDPEIRVERLPRDAHDVSQSQWIMSWVAQAEPDGPLDQIINVHCLADTGDIYAVLGDNIVLIHPNAGPDDVSMEYAGPVNEDFEMSKQEAGISAAAWSPDEEIVLIATKDDKLWFLTRGMQDVIACVPLSGEDLKVSDHVSVGWGKAETQFKGRGAKAMRDPTVPEHVDLGVLSKHDDGRTTISWRGDGQYVAMNSVLEVGEIKRRVIRVFSREGVLESVSEPVDGLEGALSWKPSGQLIAGVQRREDRVDVVFFERNGLRHGEFSLRLTPSEVNDPGERGSSIALEWNADSSVLAVILADCVQLWTMGNYHYYLKQQIFLSDGYVKSLPTVWHPEHALRLTTAAGEDLHILGYEWAVARGSVVPPHDRGLVAVTDGQQLKITPLRTANVPPPMAFDEITLPSNAIDVAISQSGTLIAVLHEESVSYWSCDYAARPAKRAKLLRTSPLLSTRGDSSLWFQQIVLPDDNGNAMIAASATSKLESVLTVQTMSGDCEQYDLPRTNALMLSHDHRSPIFQDAHGGVHRISPSGAVEGIGKLPVRCASVQVWQDSNELTTILFGLSSNGILHVKSDSQALKIQGCTSFEVTSTHLIYTTTQHLLKFVHLSPTSELIVPADEPEKDERCRSIERGAKLVTVIPSAFSVVLQMPRGNLETIYPRALVLAGIRQAVAERDYAHAFLICRTHRVDMNILHDYAPEQFMRDVELFVKQVKKVEYIDLFLSSLSEENVSETIYKDTIVPASGDAPTTAAVSDSSSKVNRICDGFLKALDTARATHLQNIVTCHVCKNPPDLESGLRLISELRISADQTQVEQAVEHICFLADVNQLYDSALGIYDLDVALLVAQQSQKDPREYLPYLQKLQEMPDLRRRFTIDDDLKRRKKALGHLHAQDDFNGVKNYAAQHELYNAAIDLYRYDNARLVELTRLYADFLLSQNRNKEAGIAYEYVCDYPSAQEAYQAAGMWRECLSCAALSEVSEGGIKSLASDIADSLVEAKDFIAAGTIKLDYLSDLDGAVRLFCKGYHFSDAIRHVAIAKRPDLLTSAIDPGLIEASAGMTEMLAEMKTQIFSQVPRLRELREKKAADPLSFLDGGGDENDADIPDNVSLAPTEASTSGGTFMTRYTNRSTGTLATNATRRTSKNRRREERKRAKGKKGTVYEEEYLVNSLTRLIERLNAIAEDVERLREGLLRRSMRERALAVDLAYKEVVNASRACVGEVYEIPKQPMASGGSAEISSEAGPAEARPIGGQGVFWEAVVAAQQRREPPVIKGIEALSLLESSER